MAKEKHSVKAIAPKFPIQEEPKIMTLAKPLIIESAFPGWLPIAVNPNIPIKAAEISREIIDSVKAGAAAIHVHPRDPVDGSMMMDPELLKETLDPVFAACGNVLTWNHSWSGEIGKPLDYFSHTKEMLKIGNGNKYIQSSVVLITGNPTERDQILWGDAESVKEGVPFLESNRVKPIFQIYDTTGIDWLAREIIKPGIAKWKPFMCCLHMGKHHSTFIGQDPWGHLQLMASMNALRANIPDCLVGLRAGGRNWLPIVTSALAMGIDMVGVGMEDCLWMYPHKDEVIKKNADTVKKVVQIAEALGREVATSDRARQMLGF